MRIKAEGIRRTVRTVSLPATGRTISLRQYLDGVKYAKANPDEEFKTGLTSWWPTTGREIVAQFMRGVHDRINQAVPYIERGM